MDGRVFRGQGWTEDVQGTQGPKEKIILKIMLSCIIFPCSFLLPIITNRLSHAQNSVKRDNK